jgi:hypothetical protein
MDALVDKATHLADDELDAYLKSTLSPERVATVRAHVVKCKACGDKLVAGLVTKLGELNDVHRDHSRVEQRIQTSQSGRLQTLSPLSFEQVPIQIQDVSRSGFGITAPKPLQPGNLVLVEAGTNSLVGEVRSCQSDGANAFRVGIRLETEQKPAVSGAGPRPPN